MSEKTPLVDNKVRHYYFINNVFSSFFRGLADYFRTDWFPRTNETIIATYEKAVQHIKNRRENGDENYSPRFPFITFNPEMDFEPDDQAGRFFYGYPNFSGKIARDAFAPDIYNDGNLKITPVLNRYRGNFEMIVWCGSIYELMDVRFYVYQKFGGLNRPIYPKVVQTFIDIPDDILYYTYDNPYTKNKYTLNWENSDVDSILIKNINKNRIVYPCSIVPYIKLTGTNDGSEKYGGSGDLIGEHRLSINVEWECHLPSHLFLSANLHPDKFHDISFEISASTKYFKYDIDLETKEVFQVPYEVTSGYTDIDSSNSKHHYDGIVSGETVDLIYDKIYSYNITENDKNLIDSEETDDSEKRVTFTIDSEVDDILWIKIFGKYGELDKEYQYNLLSSDTIELLLFNLRKYDVDDILTVVVYKPNI